MTLPIALAIVFFLFNIFFVLAEFALVRVQVPRIEIMAGKGIRRAGLVLSMVKNLDRYLSAVQLGVTMCTIGLGWVGEPAISRVLTRHLADLPLTVAYSGAVSVALSFILITYFQIVFAELVPRSVAINNAENIMLWVAVPLQVFSNIFRFPIFVMTKSSLWITSVLGVPPVGEHEQVFSEEEMRLILGTSQDKGMMPLDRFLLLENLFDFGSLRVRDAMTPRDKIDFLALNRSWEENRYVLNLHRFSRYPLTISDLDHVVGYVHIKDLAFQASDSAGLDMFKKPVSFVGENEPLQAMLKTMSGQGKPFYLVTDASKRVTGLITLEDVLEELVGEIHDEFDVPHKWALNEYLRPEHVELDLKGGTAGEAIRALCDRMKGLHPDLDAEAVTKAVLQRESLLATAIGKGVAVPHARLAKLERPVVVIGRSARPIGFNAPDKTPVRLLFMLLTPASAPMFQLRLLSRVATLMSNAALRKQLFKVKTASAFVDTLRTSESLLSG
jgi:CBS domain containing-hemolysin-like protein/mannitol/fructose-specific phosphotransferase system IIA component (Ntr-type)